MKIRGTAARAHTRYSLVTAGCTRPPCVNGSPRRTDTSSPRTCLGSLVAAVGNISKDVLACSGQVIGHGRASTMDLNPERRILAVQGALGADPDRWFTGQSSAGSTDRPEVAAMLAPVGDQDLCRRVFRGPPHPIWRVSGRRPPRATTRGGDGGNSPEALTPRPFACAETNPTDAHRGAMRVRYEPKARAVATRN